MDIMLIERGGGIANCGDDGFATVVLAVVAGMVWWPLKKYQEIPRKIGGDLTPYLSGYLLVFRGIFQILLQT